MTLILLLIPSSTLVFSGNRQWLRMPGRYPLSLSANPLQRLDPAVDRPGVPAVPEPAGVPGVPVVPQAFEVVLEHVSFHQRPVGREQFVQPHPVLLPLDVVAVPQQQPA